jgi:hypothetical protein
MDIFLIWWLMNNSRLSEEVVLNYYVHIYFYITFKKSDCDGNIICLSVRFFKSKFNFNLERKFWNLTLWNKLKYNIICFLKAGFTMHVQLLHVLWNNIYIYIWSGDVHAKLSTLGSLIRLGFPFKARTPPQSKTDYCLPAWRTTTFTWFTLLK